MLVPLTDSTNPYAAMMLTIIEDGRRRPHSRWPRQTSKPGFRTRARLFFSFVRPGARRHRPASSVV
jgi:hypothetical protein